MAAKFLDLCLAGEVDPEQIDDFVDSWHEGGGGEEELPEFLGLDADEYAMWVAEPRFLHSVLSARRFGLPLKRAVTDSREMAMAARAISAEEADEVLKWLQRTGRL